MRRAIPLLFIAAFVGCSPTKPTTSAKARMSRDEFKTLVVGKTKDLLLQNPGKPDENNEGELYTSWIYYNATFDKDTGKPDREANIMIVDGVAKSVAFISK